MINGKAYSHSSITVMANGSSIAVEDINYEVNIDRVKLWGNSRTPRKITKGKVEVQNCSLTMAYDEFDAFRRSLGVFGFMDRKFSVIVAWKVMDEDGIGGTTEELIDCYCKKVKISSKTGPDPVTVSVEFDCMNFATNYMQPNDLPFMG
jgi:hypothetical protein